MSGNVEEHEIKITQPAGPSQSAVERTVAQTVVRTNVDRTGEVNETSPDINDTANDETSVLTNEEVSEEKSALTSYLDVTKTQVSHEPGTALDIVDKNFVFPPGYFKVCERSIPLGAFDLPTTAPNQYPYLRLDIANQLLWTPAIANKLTSAVYVRYNLEVELKLLATNYHYGQLMVVWRPAYGPFIRARQYKKNNQSFIVEVGDNKSGFSAYGPYDNVFTASQLDHHIMAVTAGSNLTIKLPWLLNKQYVPSKTMMWPENHPGFLDIYLLTPVGPADIDKARIQIYGRFTDVVGFGYRAPGEPCGDKGDYIIRRHYMLRGYAGSEHMKMKYPTSYPYPFQSVNIETPSTMAFIYGSPTTTLNRGVKVYPYWRRFPTQKAAGDSTSNTKTKSVSSQETEENVENHPNEVLESGRMESELESQEKGGALYQTYNKAVAGANTIATWIGDGLAYLGLSKPPMKGIPSRWFSMAPPMSNAVGPDFTVSTGFNPEASLPNKTSDHSNMTQIENIGKCETFIGYRNFSNTIQNESLVIAVSPRFVIQIPSGDGERHCAFNTPQSLLTHGFEYWRSSCKYRLHFSSSSFVTARYSITIAYDGKYGPAEGIVPTQFVEVKGDTVIEGTIPYLYPTAWRCEPDEPLAIITVKLVDRVVCWKNISAQPIYCAIWLSYPGLQVAMPRADHSLRAGFCAIPWGVTLKGMDQPTHGLPEWSEKYPMWPKMIATWENDKKLGGDVEIEEIVESAKAHAATELMVKKQIRALDAVEYRPNEILEVGSLPGTTRSGRPRPYGMNDIPTSLYHLAKRYNLMMSSWVLPYAPAPGFAFSNDGSLRMIVTCPTFNSLMASCFRWWRGGACYFTTSSTAVSDVVNQSRRNPAQYSYNDGPEFMLNWTNSSDYQNTLLLPETLINPHVLKGGQSATAVRSPFRSNHAFVSGPHLCVWYETESLDSPKFGAMYDACRETLNATFFNGQGPNGAGGPAWTEMSYADDLCYNTWMGAPMTCTVLNPTEFFLSVKNKDPIPL